MAPQGSSDPRATPLLSLVAGGAAGGIEASLTYPFEFAKTRVQLRVEQAVQKGEPGKPPSSVRTPRNPFVVIGQVVKNEGVRALYLGCSTLVLGTIAKDAIRFVSFDSIKRAFADKETGKLSPLGNMAAGMSAGVVASTFAVTPTERLKTALIDDAREHGLRSATTGPTTVTTTEKGRGSASEGRRFKSAIHAARVLVADHGIYGLYRGYVTTTLKQAGTTSVRMGMYNILKQLEEDHYHIPQTGVTSFANGAVAGLITTYVTQPIDTIKTRAQSAKGAGIVEAASTIYQDYGIKGFWRGSTMRLGRTIFAGGILFTAYEQIMALLLPVMGRKVDREGQPI